MQCPRCGHTVSGMAQACPACGYMLPFALRRTFAERPATPPASAPAPSAAPTSGALTSEPPAMDAPRSEQEAARHGPLSNALDPAALAPRVPAGGRPTRPTLEPISIEDLMAALAADPGPSPAGARATSPDLAAAKTAAQAPSEPESSPTDPMPALSTGALLRGGQYRLLQRFGAFSAEAADPPLFLASDAHDGGGRVLVQELPVHRMPPEEAERSMRVAVARLKEARQHTLVPEVLDSFVERGRCFLIFGMPGGSRLSEVIAREGPLAEPMVVQLGVRLLDTLGRFASQTPPLVHGNLCPEHIFVHPNQLVELVGISPSLLTLRNQAGVVCGVAEYAAPEQRRGLASEQSDQYAVATILSNIAVGRAVATPAFSRGNAGAAGHPYPAKLSAALDAILARAQQSDPLDRYESADEMRRALLAIPPSALAAARGSDTRPTSKPATITAGLTPAAAALRATMELPAITIARRKRSRVWPTIMVVALLTLLGAAIFIGWQLWAHAHHPWGYTLPWVGQLLALGLNPTWTATTPPVR